MPQRRSDHYVLKKGMGAAAAQGEASPAMGDAGLAICAALLALLCVCACRYIPRWSGAAAPARPGAT